MKGVVGWKWWVGMMERMVMFFFFNDTATTEIYTLSLHDALPISSVISVWLSWSAAYWMALTMF